MQLSVVDQSPVSEGSTAAEALRNTVALAQATERLGYRRYWLAEHHNTRALAGTAPEVLTAHVAGQTTSIRVGAGGVLLSYYSPLKVAEAFRTLHALFPGRIDLGLARANADTASGAVLAQGPGAVGDEHYPRHVADVVGFLHGSFPPGHPWSEVDANPAAFGGPELWVLSSSSYGSGVAAGLGLAFSFAHFVTPKFGPQILASYRARFRPSPQCPAPRANVGVSVMCADTDAEAERLALSGEIWRLESDRTQRGPLLSAEDAEAHPLSELDRAQLAQRRDRVTVGAPDRVRDRLIDIADSHGVDELVILTVCHDHEARLRSYELLAGAFDLEPGPAGLHF